MPRAVAGEPVVKLLSRSGLRLVDSRRLAVLPEGPIDAAARRAEPASKSASGRAPEAPRVRVAAPHTKNTAYFALLVHSHGGMTFHYEKKRRGKDATHVIDVPLAQRIDQRASRGGAAYTLLLWAAPFAAGMIAAGLRVLARRWEDKRIPHRFVRVGARGTARGKPLTALPHHEGKRGLLIIHGLFSSTQAGFAPLFEPAGASFMRTIMQAYEGKVVGFDHPTASRTPEENARWLLEHLERGHTCRYDVLATSRGGLVARSLVELARKRRTGAFGQGGRRRSKSTRAGSLVIDRVILVGTPNAGTPLVPSGGGGSSQAYDKLAAWLANTAALLPGRVLPWFADALAALLKFAACNIPGTLPGVGALAPGSPFLETLNEPSHFGGAMYYGIGGNFDAPRKLLLKLADASLDALFEGEENDLAVPTAGCAFADEPLPAERAALFSPWASAEDRRDNIHHFGYLRSKKCLRQIEFFLGIARTAARGAPLTRRGAAAASKAAQRGAEADELIGDERQKAFYKEWLARWKKAIAEARITTLPPEPFPFLAASSGLSRCVRTFKTSGDDTYWHSLIGTERSLRRYLEDAGPELSRSRIESAGAMLYRTLFSGEPGKLFERIRPQSKRQAPLIITFTSTNPWIADFPWEMMYDPARKRFLHFGDICLFRGVMSTTAAVALPILPMVIRMLIAVSMPRDQAELDYKKEVKELRTALAPLVESRRLYIDVLEHTSMRSLRNQLRRTRYHILHYIGHGDYDEASDTGTLILEKDRTGISEPAGSDDLCDAIRAHAPQMRLAVLNGCETAEGGRADFNRGVAPALVASGLPCVIGNRLIVGDGAAVTFSSIFYEELSKRRSLAEAIMSARRALATSSDFEPYEWAVPIIFAIDPEARFF
ncbi:MAG: CHAT domain-containing protein [Chitinivibrionia bacterium]|nr:CHAT domain-containing protein [Chitinivibrionia bacterium]